MKIIRKLIKLLEVTSRKLMEKIKRILMKLMEKIKAILKKYIEMVKAIIEKFLKNLQVITDKIKKKIQDLKRKIFEYEYSKLIPVIALFVEILMIALWALPLIIFTVFGVMRTSVILDTSNFLIYRCISMPIMLLIRGFIAKSIQELMKDHCLLGLISITCTAIFMGLFY